MPAAGLDALVRGAVVEAGDCTFGVRDNASDPEWCHVLDVHVTDDGVSAVALASDPWTAHGDDCAAYLLPRVAGPDAAQAGKAVDITLRFSAPPHVRLLRLDHSDSTTGASATTTIRTYDVA